MSSDKNGREIRPGDVLKTLHFIGPQKKKFYMYKVAVDSPRGILAFDIGSLALKGPINAHSCPLKALSSDTEIVEGYNCEGDEVDFTDHPVLKGATEADG